MTSRKYDSVQREKLDALASIHAQRIQKKAALRAQIESQLRDALNTLEIRESLAANEALVAGVTKTDIGRAIGTANWGALSAVLARTAPSAEVHPR